MRTTYRPQTSQISRNTDVLIEQRLLVHPEEAASILGLGRSTIYELMRHGELPVVHVGRASRIPTSALTHFIERQSHQGHQTDPSRPSS